MTLILQQNISFLDFTVIKDKVLSILPRKGTFPFPHGLQILKYIGAIKQCKKSKRTIFLVQST